MKTQSILIHLMAAAAGTSSLLAQGTFVYDQQSATAPIPPNIMYEITPSQPIGQSVVPARSSVGFVQFELGDGIPQNGAGAAAYVNLRSGAIDGPIIGTSSSVSMPDSFFGVATFTFDSGVAVTPGTSYFFQPVIGSGDSWRVNVGSFHYAAGTMFLNGSPFPDYDLWFREGIVVPEPGVLPLILLGGIAGAYARRERGWLLHGR